MNGMTAEKVASSWIEALGGESMCWILSTPPDFWAAAGLADGKRQHGDDAAEATTLDLHSFPP